MRMDYQNHPPEWSAKGLRFYPLSLFFQQRFGRRVWKISIDAGLSCPNLDGTLASEGCIFCDARSFSPSRRLGGARRTVTEQITDGTSRLRRRYGEAAGGFIAYFQPATNTHGPIDDLLPLWQEAANHPEIVGLTVGTRPDCADDEILDALKGVAGDKWVSIEFGLQSIHQQSLDWLRRGHDFRCFEDSVTRAHIRGLHVGAHLMLGLPHETAGQMVETATEMARLQVDAVKLHNLYVVRNTPLADLWERGEFRLPTRDEYVQLLADFLEHLPPECVVDRIIGDAPPQYLLAPEWCRHKAAIRHAVEGELDRRETQQGSQCTPPVDPNGRTRDNRG
jgi:uncharacterized protein